MRKVLVSLLVAFGILIGPSAACIDGTGCRLGATAVAGEYDIWFRLIPPANARPGLRGWWLDQNSQYLFPPNSGFARTPHIVTLAPGTRIDRYGSPNGAYLAPAGTAYAARAVPYDKAKMEYHRYRVVRPFAVNAGTIAPWFDQRGGGIQYQSDKPVRQLIDEGYLRQVR
jgi:nicrotizing toxin Mtb-like protein